MFPVYTRTVSLTVSLWHQSNTAIGGCKSSARVPEGFLSPARQKGQAERCQQSADRRRFLKAVK